MMKIFLLIFYTKSETSNGYAIISATTPERAVTLLECLGIRHSKGYGVTSIKCIGNSIASDARIITEGIVSLGFSAYDIAVKHGYTGTEKEWAEALIASANLGEGIIDETALHIGDNVSLLVNDSNYTINDGTDLLPNEITANDSVIYLTINGKKYMLQAVELGVTLKPSITGITYNYNNTGGGTATIHFNTKVYSTSNGSTPTKELTFLNSITVNLTLGLNSSITVKAFTTKNNIDSEILEQVVTLTNKVATPTATLVGDIQSDNIYIQISGVGSYKVNGLSSSAQYPITGNGTYKVKATIDGQIDSEEVTISVNLVCPDITIIPKGRLTASSLYTTTVNTYDESRRLTLSLSQLHNVKVETSTDNTTWTERNLVDTDLDFNTDGTLYWRVTRGSFTITSGNTSWTVRHLKAPYITITATDTSGKFTINNDDDNPSDVTFKYILNSTASTVGKTYTIYTSEVSFDASSVGKTGYTYVYVMAIAVKDGWTDSTKDTGNVLLNNSGNYYYGVVSSTASITASYVKSLLTARSISSYSSILLDFGAFEDKLPIIVIAHPFMGATYNFTLDSIIDPSTNAPYQKDVDFTVTNLTIYDNAYYVIKWKVEQSTAGSSMKITYKFK